MQNKKHIVELRNRLTQFKDVPFYSVLVFCGNCVLKEINYVPEGTCLVKVERVLEVVKTILDENNPVLINNIDELYFILNEAVIKGGILENKSQHIANVQGMLGKHRIFD